MRHNYGIRRPLAASFGSNKVNKDIKNKKLTLASSRIISIHVHPLKSVFVAKYLLLEVCSESSDPSVMDFNKLGVKSKDLEHPLWIK